MSWSAHLTKKPLNFIQAIFVEPGSKICCGAPSLPFSDNYNSTRACALCTGWHCLIGWHAAYFRNLHQTAWPELEMWMHSLCYPVITHTNCKPTVACTKCWSTVCTGQDSTRLCWIHTMPINVYNKRNDSAVTHKSCIHYNRTQSNQLKEGHDRDIQILYGESKSQTSLFN